MGYMKKGGTVCNPAKKSLTVFQNSFMETYTYQSGTVPVYGDPPIIGYEEKQVAVGRGGATLRAVNTNAFVLEGTGGQAGDTYSGSAVLSWSEQIPYQGTVSHQKEFSLSLSPITGQVSNYRIVSSNVTIYRKQSTPVYGERPIIRYDPVYSQGTREAWNTKWRKLAA